ncbi:MAG: patatin-like phospholipase family protein [Proteobacteria bacterium]|nr:patatin-like phospholipase family protein [Pseudomonadota bacterium]MBU1057881.1 patatin-like phospholipase family protein [Pseudomonadota bacterium]
MNLHNKTDHAQLRKGFTLVLSGGAARGYAHVGVLSYLLERGLLPDEIIGTSMGALIGAACAVGLGPDEITNHIIKFSKLSRWLRPSLSHPALLDSHKLEKIFHGLFGEQGMEDSKIPLKIIATDFNNGQIRVFQAGDSVLIHQAVSCSMSIPVIFPPVPLENTAYVDGFLCANLPVQQVSDPEKPIIAVDVMSARANGPYQPEHPSWLELPGEIIEMYERSFYLMVQNQTRTACAQQQNIISLQPELAEFNLYDFDKVEPIIAKGYQEAVAVLG